MRRLGGWLFVVIGFLLSVAGVAGAVWIGPDDAVDSAVVRVDSPAAAIVTGPDAIKYAGPTVHLEVVSQNGPVFVGVGAEVDVEDFVSDVARTQIDAVDFPSSIKVSDVGGSQNFLAVGPDLDWWIKSDSGERVELEFSIPDQPVSVVVMNADGTPTVVVDMMAAVEIPGIFWGAVALAVIGLGLLILGVLALRRARRRRRTAGPAHGDDDADAAATSATADSRDAPTPSQAP